MSKGWAVVAALGLGMFTVATARAEDPAALRCERFVNGASKTVVSSYPATVVVDTYIYNDSQTQTFTLTSIYDWPVHTSPSPVNIPLDPGTSTGGTTVFTVQSYEQCAQLAGREDRAQAGKPIHLKTFAKVSTATGEKAKCKARVVCRP